MRLCLLASDVCFCGSQPCAHAEFTGKKSDPLTVVPCTQEPADRALQTTVARHPNHNRPLQLRHRTSALLLSLRVRAPFFSAVCPEDQERHAAGFEGRCGRFHLWQRAAVALDRPGQVDKERQPVQGCGRHGTERDTHHRKELGVRRTVSNLITTIITMSLDWIHYEARHHPDSTATALLGGS